MDFIIPLHLQDLELDVSDRYTIQTTFDYSDPSHLLQTLNGNISLNILHIPSPNDMIKNVIRFENENQYRILYT